MGNPATRHFVVTASRGTEGALAEELVELGCRGVRAASAAVEFTGTLVDAARVCLASRIGVRVLAPVADFRCPDGATLYERVRAVDWSELLSPRHTLAVSASCRESALAHEMFVAQRTKDAIVDQLRDRHGERPSVDRADPDLGLAVRVVRDRATVALDVSGTSLHLRGYRVPGAEAPLKETLAAAVVRLSGWDRQTPLVDPMCGSATLAIEADLWARRVAPGLARPRLGLERWASHDDTLRTALARLREELAAAALPEGPEVRASDVDARALEVAAEQIARSGARVALSRASVGRLSGTSPPGAIVANTPYGERVALDPGLEREIRRGLDTLSPGHRVALLVLGRPRLGAPAAARRLELWNGPLRSSLVTWQVAREGRAAEAPRSPRGR